MSDLNSLLNGMDKAKPTFLNEPYVGTGTVIGHSSSIDEKDYKGKPFISFKIRLASGVVTDGKLWTPAPGDDAEKANNKLLRIKNFLANCGLDTSIAPSVLLPQAVGKHLNVAFSQRSYIGKDKAGRPAVKTGVDLAFTNPIDKPFSASVTKESLVKALAPTDWAKLKLQQEHFDAANGAAPAGILPQSGAAYTPQPFETPDVPNIGELDDDLPF
jgi:hypothetical protein